MARNPASRLLFMVLAAAGSAEAAVVIDDFAVEGTFLPPSGGTFPEGPFGGSLSLKNKLIAGAMVEPEISSGITQSDAVNESGYMPSYSPIVIDPVFQFLYPSGSVPMPSGYSPTSLSIPFSRGFGTATQPSALYAVEAGDLFGAGSIASSTHELLEVLIEVPLTSNGSTFSGTDRFFVGIATGSNSGGVGFFPSGYGWLEIEVEVTGSITEILGSTFPSYATFDYTLSLVDHTVAFGATDIIVGTRNALPVIPEPLSVAVWAGLTGAVGLSRRSR